MAANSRQERQIEKRRRNHSFCQSPLFPKFVPGDAAIAEELRKRGARTAGRRMHGLFRWSSKWWPGTIPLAILWVIAAWSNTAPLEADLAARSAPPRSRMPCWTRRRSRSTAATSRLPPTPSRKMAGAARWLRWKPCRACGWSTTKPVSFPRPSRSSGRPSGTWSGSPWAAVRRCRPARANCWKPLTPRSAVSRWSIR